MKIVSLLLKIILGIILASAVVIGVIIAFVDPNNYRDEITQVVKKETGRDLHIESMSLSFFPNIGINLSNTRLSNAEGFGDQPFLEISNVQIGAKILPLLRQELEINALILYGLNLNLMRNTQGATNWDDLIKPSPITQPTATKTSPASKNPLAKLAAINFDGLDIQNGIINWQDQQTAQSIKLTIHHFNTNAVTFGQFFNIALQAETKVANPELQTAINLTLEAKLEQDGSYNLRNLILKTTTTGKGIPVDKAITELNIPTIDLTLDKNQINFPKLTLNYDVVGGQNFPMQSIKGELTLSDIAGDLSIQSFKASQLAIHTDLTGQSLPNGQAQIKVTNQPSINLTAQTAELANFSLTALGIQTQGSVKATQIIDNPLINAQIAIPQINLRDLLSQLEIALPEMTDNTTLTQFTASLGIKFNSQTQAININNLSIHLDDSKLTGDVAVSQFDRPNIAYNLALTTIDLNRYLSPKKDLKETEKPVQTPEDVEIILPTELLRSLTLDGTFTANSIIFDNLNPQNILLTVKGTAGKINANPIEVDIFGTQIRAQAGLDVRGQIPKYTFKTATKQVPIGEVLLAFTGKDQLTGTGAINLSITTEGSRVSHFKQNLNGTTNFNLKDGAIKGFNLARSIREARAKISGKTLPKSDAKLQTDFTAMTGQFVIKQGIVDTKNLVIQAPFMRISGLGQINLPKESLDYLVKTKIVGTAKGQGGQELKDLSGLTIPVKITGSWLEPDISLDLKSIFEQKAKAEIEQKKQEVITETKKKVEEKLKESILKGFGF